VTRTVQERLTDISEAAERVIRAVAALEQAEADGRDDEAQLAFDALLYRLVVIGEAVKALPEELRARHPQIPWREIARLRDLLAHHYYRVDARVIRRTVESPLSELQGAVTQLLEGPMR
jgi:uncharacterized protein with HEPN domain